MNRKKGLFSVVVWVCCCIMLMGMVVGASAGDDLAEIKERGVLRHLGVPYAKFVTGSGDGLSVELIKLFAQHLGVTYEYVETDWKNVIGDLTGKIVTPKGDDIEILGEVPVRGDVIANGLTLLPWRQKVLDYSDPTFPSGVWLIARADSSLVPIVTSGEINVDIGVTKEMLQGQTVLTTPNSCLDPRLYDLHETTDSKILTFNGNPAKIVPALLKNEAETSLLDIPDALIGLEKWAGQIKVVGPISHKQEMGCGFAKTAPKLREAFNQFFEKIRLDGTYLKLVKSYYPMAEVYFPDFFEGYIVNP